MATKGKTNKKTAATATDGHAQILDEAPYPVIRVSSKGKTLYTNPFSSTIAGLVNAKSGAVAEGLTREAAKCFKEGMSTRYDFESEDHIYEFFINPVADQDYINMFGRDVSRSRVTEKRVSDIAKFPSENPNPVIRAEPDGTVLFANDSARNLQGVILAGTPSMLTDTIRRAAMDAATERKVCTSDFAAGDKIYLFTAMPIEGETYINIYGREITAEREAQKALLASNDLLEQRIADRTASVRLLQNIVLSANSADSFEAALQTALHEICIYTKWPVGHAYIVEEENDKTVITPSGIWHIESDSELSDLRTATESLRFGSADGIPGRVISRGQAVWVEDISREKNFERAEFVDKAGIKSAMAFPVLLDDHVIGVLEFFSQEEEEADVEIIKTLVHVGTQLGSVAERKKAEAEVVKSQKDAATAHFRLTSALEVINQAFALFDKDDRIVLFNKRYADMIVSIMGRPPKIGETFETIIRASAAIGYIPERVADGKMEQWIEDVLRERRETDFRDDINQQKDGSWFRAQGFRTDDGGTVSIFTDVTEMKEHEAEMEGMMEELGNARDEAVKANSTKSQFLANMSHELRTPLNAIIGYSELLIDDVEDDDNEDYIPDLEKIKNAGTHLLGLINDILDLSKIEVGKIELFIEEFDLNDMLEDVSNTIKPLVEKNENNLIIEKDKDVGKVFSDMTKLRQNMFNLLSNASKFSKNSDIIVRVNRGTSINGDTIEFHVEDRGIGMTPEQVEKIFEPFTQADSSTSKEYGGTGLGMTITREFCRKLGGDIVVNSELGKGTTFTMTILEDGQNLHQLEAVDYDSTVVDVADDAPLILVIDDDRNVRDLLRRNLTSSGYRTIVASGGDEGLKMAEENQPDAITLDVVMPQTDGWTVLSKLKSNKATEHIPVVMVTIVEDRSLGISLGASEYLSKPVDRGQLLSVLKRFLGEDISRTILLVEDDAETRTVLRRYLGREGARLIEAENGRVGLEKLAESKPALILLDLMMPEMDGFEFVEKYREHPEWHNIPIVVLTAKSLTEEDRKRLDGWVQGLYKKGDKNIEHVLKEVCALLPPSK